MQNRKSNFCISLDSRLNEFSVFIKLVENRSLSRVVNAFLLEYCNVPDTDKIEEIIDHHKKAILILTAEQEELTKKEKIASVEAGADFKWLEAQQKFREKKGLK